MDDALRYGGSSAGDSLRVKRIAESDLRCAVNRAKRARGGRLSDNSGPSGTILRNLVRNGERQFSARMGPFVDAHEPDVLAVPQARRRCVVASTTAHPDRGGRGDAPHISGRAPMTHLRGESRGDV